jgi:hypothetical protein
VDKIYWAYAIGAIGAFLGLFFALNGFGGTLKSEDLKNTARVRNLIGLVTAAGGVVLADWKKLASNAPDSGYLFVAYLIGALGGAIAGLVLIIGFIAVDILTTNRQRRDGRTLPPTLVVDYLHYGYAYYTQRRREILEQANTETAKLYAQERLERLERDAAVQDVIAGLVHGVSSTLEERDPARQAGRRADLIDLILKGVVSAVVNEARSDIHDLKIQANYMTFIPSASATPEQRNAALFRFGDDARYTGLLMHQISAAQVQETVVLPVDGKISDRDTLLPGAPEAFVLRRAAIINCGDIAFRKGVDKKTCAAIQKFFADVQFASVASIPIATKDGPIGVINVESNRPDLLGEGAEVGKAACNTLQPFAALLSRLL